MDSTLVKETQPGLPIPSEGLLATLFIVRDEVATCTKRVKA